MLIIGIIFIVAALALFAWVQWEQRGLEMSAAGTGLLFVYGVDLILLVVGLSLSGAGVWLRV